MAEPEINLGQIVGKDHKYELSVSNESPEDAAARRALETAEVALKRKMNFTVFHFALAVTAAVLRGRVVVFATGTPDDKNWAAAIVSASGLVGFRVGQGKR